MLSIVFTHAARGCTSSKRERTAVKRDKESVFNVGAKTEELQCMRVLHLFEGPNARARRHSSEGNE